MIETISRAAVHARQGQKQGLIVLNQQGMLRKARSKVRAGFKHNRLKFDMLCFSNLHVLIVTPSSLASECILHADCTFLRHELARSTTRLVEACHLFCVAFGLFCLGALQMQAQAAAGTCNRWNAFVICEMLRNLLRIFN